MVELKEVIIEVFPKTINMTGIKCLKCNRHIDPRVYAEKMTCSVCRNKYKFELKIPLEEVGKEFIFTTDKCPKCQQVRVVDFLNWEEIKVLCVKQGLRTKEEAIRKFNNDMPITCYCGNLEDNITERERERERESKIANLRIEIQQLELIINRTPQQEQELREKRQELVQLEQEKQQGQNSNNTKWIPWVIGGIVILVLVGIIVYLLMRKKEKSIK